MADKVLFFFPFPFSESNHGSRYVRRPNASDKVHGQVDSLLGTEARSVMLPRRADRVKWRGCLQGPLNAGATILTVSRNSIEDSGCFLVSHGAETSYRDLGNG